MPRRQPAKTRTRRRPRRSQYGSPVQVTAKRTSPLATVKQRPWYPPATDTIYDTFFRDTYVQTSYVSWNASPGDSTTLSLNISAGYWFDLLMVRPGGGATVNSLVVNGTTVTPRAFNINYFTTNYLSAPRRFYEIATYSPTITAQFVRQTGTGFTVPLLGHNVPSLLVSTGLDIQHPPTFAGYHYIERDWT